MPKRIKIKIGGEIFDAELNDTKTSEEIYKALPVSGRGKRWGDEIYFSIPVSCQNERPQQEVEICDLVYWPDGRGFCILYGRTPASKSDKPRLYSPGTVIGKIHADPDKLRRLENLDIEVRRAES